MGYLIYTDIFATKGIEYLLVIGFLIALILFWRLLRGSEIGPEAAGAESGSYAPGWFLVPDGLYFHRGHTWAKPEAGGIVTIGMDDFAQKLVGKPSALALPRVGEVLEQAKSGWKVEVDGKTLEMLSPVQGEVVAVNEEVAKRPDIVNSDPYQKGWLLKLKDRRLNADLKNLLTGKLARAWMEDVEDALRQRIYGDLSAALPDGGVPVSGIARSLDPENWEQVAREFLLTDQ
ncbi:MAG: glycine cleavage system protein H [Chlorobi bacterium]|nr:glycine cleavage system protein H [Chlorobiota bacterium]